MAADGVPMLTICGLYQLFGRGFITIDGQEIPGIGPTRKRALLRHFGTLKAIERASAADLEHVPGINAETARKIYDFFHESAARA